MTTALPLAELGLNKAFDQLESQWRQRFDKHAIDLDGLSDEIAGMLDAGSSIPENIEEYLRTTSDVPARLRSELSRFLRTKRGWILVKTEREREALADAAALIESDAGSVDGWTLRAVALLNSERFAEACQSFKIAFEFAEEEPPVPARYIRPLITGWNECALLWALRGIIDEDSSVAQQAAIEYRNLKTLSKDKGVG